MPKDSFSVAIACSHRAESLDATLHALAELDYAHDYEVIVIDDGAWEGREGPALRAKRAGLTTRYINLPGIGRASAWNVALQESSAEYLAFLADGCMPAPDWLTAYNATFDEWTTGVAGGPDSAPKHASFFERSLDYVLDSFIGTLGTRTGGSTVCTYYPRMWNMAARREALRLAGGFDESTPESPEVMMISRLRRIGYKAVYQPDAQVERGRTGLLGLLVRTFRLSAERGRGTAQPGLSRVYLGALTGLLVVLGASATPGRENHLALWASAAYGLVLAWAGIHAAIRSRNPLAAMTVPPLMLIHHLTHLAGYALGLLRRLIPIAFPREGFHAYAPLE